MKALAGIRTGYAENLIIRSADVALKERRKLILMVRETPFNQIHIENMLAVVRAGWDYIPSNPSVLSSPERLDDIINHGVGRLLDLAGLDPPHLPRWNARNRNSSIHD